MGQALGCVQVQESNVAVVERCGKFNDVLKPGYHCVPWCLGCNLVGTLPLSLQLLDVRCETKTKDDVFVTVFASVQYRSGALKKKEEEKEKARNAFYNLPLANAKAQIRVCVLDVIRDKVTKMNLDDAFEGMKEIAETVKDTLEAAMSANGYEIVQALILDIDPDVKVKTAMNDKFAAAIKNKETTEKAKAEIELQIKQAEADIELQIKRAEADIELQIKRAEADDKSKCQSGLGIARQRQAILNGLRESVHAFTESVPGTTGKDVIDMELVTQYFDTMKEIGTSSKVSHVFILHGPDGVKDIAAELRDHIIQGNTSKK